MAPKNSWGQMGQAVETQGTQKHVEAKTVVGMQQRAGIIVKDLFVRMEKAKEQRALAPHYRLGPF